MNYTCYYCQAPLKETYRRYLMDFYIIKLLCDHNHPKVEYSIYEFTKPHKDYPKVYFDYLSIPIKSNIYFGVYNSPNLNVYFQPRPKLFIDKTNDFKMPKYDIIPLPMSWLELSPQQIVNKCKLFLLFS